MLLIAASLGQIALVAVAVISVAVIATWALNRRRRDVWREFAKHRRLRFVEPPDGPRVTGQVAERPVEVVINDAGSDRDVGGVEVVRMSVTLRGVPKQMTTEGVPGLIGDLTAIAEDRIEFDDEDFHRDVLVMADDEKGVRTYWTDQRQQTFLELVRSAPCDQIAIRDGILSAELREIVSDRDQLENLMDQLVAAATTLDIETGAKDS